MKKIVILSVFIFIFGVTYSQSFTIANEKMNVFYMGIENPISITVEDIPNKLLLLKTNNGVIKKDSYGFKITPLSLVKTEISIYKKVKGKAVFVGVKEFRVKRIPLIPTFKIGSGRKKITMVEIANQKYVRADIEDVYEDNIEIEKFTVTIKYKDTTIIPISFKNNSNKIEEILTKNFFLLKEGDEVIFTEIFANAPWEKYMILEDQSVIITQPIKSVQ